jgi:chaperonin GroES
MFENFKPLNGRVLIQRQHLESDSVIISPTAEEKSPTGKVISVGVRPKSKSSAQVNVGDIVYIGKYAGTDLGVNDYIIVNADDILGVIEKN